ncbi:MAG: hypothetical protein ACYTEL_15800 [Planctomycetota bacterium]
MAYRKCLFHLVGVLCTPRCPPQYVLTSLLVDKSQTFRQAEQLSAMSGQLIRADSEEQKQPLIQKIKTFLVENGMGVAQSLTASAIFELAKAVF